MSARYRAVHLAADRREPFDPAPTTDHGWAVAALAGMALATVVYLALHLLGWWPR